MWLLRPRFTLVIGYSPLMCERRRCRMNWFDETRIYSVHVTLTRTPHLYNPLPTTTGNMLPLDNLKGIDYIWWELEGESETWAIVCGGRGRGDVEVDRAVKESAAYPITFGMKRLWTKTISFDLVCMRRRCTQKTIAELWLFVSGRALIHVCNNPSVTEGYLSWTIYLRNWNSLHPISTDKYSHFRWPYLYL
jgi:hypothetical protein